MRFVAGRDAVAERHREDVAGRGAEAEMLAGAPRQRWIIVVQMWILLWSKRAKVVQAGIM